MKTNFESIEFNRTFDKIYLVSQIIDASAHPGGNMQEASAGATSAVADVDIKKVAGIISLSKLLENQINMPEKLWLWEVKVVKVNNGIMGKTGFTYKMEPL